MTLLDRVNGLSHNQCVAIGTVIGLTFAHLVRRLEMRLERNLASAVMLAQVDEVLHWAGDWHDQGNSVVALMDEWREFTTNNNEEDN